MDRLRIVLLQTSTAIRVHESEAHLRRCIALLGGFAVPLNRLLVILGDTAATITVHGTEIALSYGVFLLRGFAIQPDGVRLVLGDAVAGLVRIAEIDLAESIPLLGSLAKPLNGLCIVLWQPTATIAVRYAKIVLAVDIPLLSSFAEPLYCLPIVLRDATTVAIHESETKLSRGISLLGHLPPQTQCR